MRFEELSELLSTQARTLFSLFSHNFIAANLVCDEFKGVIQRIEASNNKIVLDEKIIWEQEFKPFNKWLHVAAIKFMAGNDEQTLAKL